MKAVERLFGVQLVVTVGAYLLLEPLWVGRLHWDSALLIGLIVIAVSQAASRR